MKQIYQTLKLSWEEIGTLTGTMISVVLKRDVTCRAAFDDYNYWTVSDTAGRFSHDDLDILLDYVDADSEIRKIVFGFDSDTTEALDMELAQALLKKKLNTSWERELVTEDGLWLVGIDSGRLNYTGTITINGRNISMDTLWPKDEFVKPGRCYVRLSQNDYTALQQAIRADGFDTMQSWLEEMIKDYLANRADVEKTL